MCALSSQVLLISHVLRKPGFMSLAWQETSLQLWFFSRYRHSWISIKLVILSSSWEASACVVVSHSIRESLVSLWPISAVKITEPTFLVVYLQDQIFLFLLSFSAFLIRVSREQLQVTVGLTSVIPLWCGCLFSELLWTLPCFELIFL